MKRKYAIHPKDTCLICYEETQRCRCGREYCVHCDELSTPERCERCEEEITKDEI